MIDQTVRGIENLIIRKRHIGLGKLRKACTKQGVLTLAIRRETKRLRQTEHQVTCRLYIIIHIGIGTIRLAR